MPRPFPLLLFAHGYGYNYSLLDLERLAASGIAAAMFDFRGGSPHSRSGGDSREMSVLSEQNELFAVLDFLRGDTRFDPKRLFLSGHSQGGYVATMVAVQRPAQVRGLFLLAPAML